MRIIYSNHAEIRMRQRGISELDVTTVLTFPTYVIKPLEGKNLAVGEIAGRTIKVIFAQTESYIKVITVI